jgi:hypothetical protein
MTRSVAGPCAVLIVLAACGGRTSDGTTTPLSAPTAAASGTTSGSAGSDAPTSGYGSGSSHGLPNPDPCQDRCTADEFCKEGACIERGAAGETCPGACAAGLHCDRPTNTCAAPAAAGAWCDGLTDCADGLYCDGVTGKGNVVDSTEPGVCRTRGSLGDPCTAIWQCQNDVCRSGVCDPGDNGESCTAHSECASGWCPDGFCRPVK